MTKNNTAQTVYTILSIILPVLSIYATPINGLDLGTACILLFVMVLIGKRTVFRINTLISVLLVYSFIITIPAILEISTNYSSERIVLFRMMRFILLMVIMIGFGYSNYYCEQKYTKIYEVAAIIVSSYAIIQSVFFKVTGVKLRNIFGTERGGAVFSSSLGEYESVYRPPSFFLEPSGVTYFLTPILCFVLFCDKKLSAKRFVIAILITAGILVSTSGQGLLIVALCWGIWGLTRINTMRVGEIIILIISAIIFFSSYDISYTVSRITTEEEANAVDARSIGYELVKDMKPESFIFGNGYGNYDESVYYSSFAEIIFCTGYLGLFLILLLYSWFFIKGVEYQRVLVLASILLMIGGGIYTPTYLCLYIPLLLPRKQRPFIQQDKN
ncbi:MAG: hypothetical protein J6U22_05455 [Bacteroidaceae bacterium]|nr:hypothetical protein [Bacteroidaceae bacterium]